MNCHIRLKFKCQADASNSTLAELWFVATLHYSELNAKSPRQDDGTWYQVGIKTYWNEALPTMICYIPITDLYMGQDVQVEVPI